MVSAVPGTLFTPPSSSAFLHYLLKFPESRSCQLQQLIQTIAMAVVESSIHFLTRDKLYEHEKPYQLKYTPAKGIPTTNIRLEKQESIKINSIRGQERQFSLEKNGFTVLKMNKEIPYDDFSNPAGVNRYLNLVAELLKTSLGADKVQVYQYTVSTWKILRADSTQRSSTDDPKIRKRDPGFPVAKKDEEYKFTQPSTVAHLG